MALNITFESLFSRPTLFPGFSKQCCKDLNRDVERVFQARTRLAEKVLNKHRAGHFLQFLKARSTTPDNPIKFDHLAACMLLEQWLDDLKLQGIVIGERNGKRIKWRKTHSLLNHESLWDKPTTGRFINTAEIKAKLLELLEKYRYLITEIVAWGDVDLLRAGTLEHPIQENGARLQKLKEIALAHVDLSALRKNSKLGARGMINSDKESLRMAWYMHLLIPTEDQGRMSPAAILLEANRTLLDNYVEGFQNDPIDEEWALFHRNRPIPPPLILQFGGPAQDLQGPQVAPEDHEVIKNYK